MTMDFDKEFVKALYGAEADFEDLHVMRYSGRGMMGRECVAVQGSRSDLDRFMAEFVKLTMDHMVGAFDEDDDDFAHDYHSFAREAVDTLFEFEEDQLGLNRVRYWKAVPFVEVKL